MSSHRSLSLPQDEVNDGRFRRIEGHRFRLSLSFRVPDAKRVIPWRDVVNLVVAVRAGYAEIDGFKEQGFWSRTYLRAGRQFRYGAGIATFDGLTVGYRGPSVEASAISAARTANPSMAEEENGGMSNSAVTSEASTQPKASWRCSWMGVRGRMWSRMYARTSSTGRRSPVDPRWS